MKKLIFALCILALAVSTVAAFNPKPDPQWYAWTNATIDTGNHTAVFSPSAGPCGTPAHKGLLAGHNHSWETMHNIFNTQICEDYTVTSGNWIGGTNSTIWQLKRSHCNCEGWNDLLARCAYAQGYIRAYCWYS